MKTALVLAVLFSFTNEHPWEIKKDKKLMVKEIKHKGETNLEEVS